MGRFFFKPSIMNIENTQESIGSLIILTGNSANSVDFGTLKGHVIGCVIYAKGDNPGFVRASIKDNAGKEVSRLQSIENYRSRDTSYQKGCKPLNLMAENRTFTLEVQATQPFTTDFYAEVIFIYKAETCN